jgi:hypothetical protein
MYRPNGVLARRSRQLAALAKSILSKAALSAEL